MVAIPIVPLISCLICFSAAAGQILEKPSLTSDLNSYTNPNDGILDKFQFESTTKPYKKSLLTPHPRYTKYSDVKDDIQTNDFMSNLSNVDIVKLLLFLIIIVSFGAACCYFCR